MKIEMIRSWLLRKIDGGKMTVCKMRMHVCFLKP